MQSRGFAARRPPALQARGVEVGDPETLRPAAGAEGYSLGEGYGFLRMVPRGPAPRRTTGPRDILVTEGSFEDLGLVAGLVTALPQNLHSHVNLRLREKQIPNARVPGVYDDQVVALLDGKLAHLTVTANEAPLRAGAAGGGGGVLGQHRPPPRAAAGRSDRDARCAGSPMLPRRDGRLTVAQGGQPGRAVPAAARRPTGRRRLRHPLLGPPGLHGGDTGLQAQVEALLADPRLTTDAPFRRAAPGRAAPGHRGGARAAGADRPAGGRPPGGLRRRLRPPADPLSQQQQRRGRRAGQRRGPARFGPRLLRRRRRRRRPGPVALPRRPRSAPPCRPSWSGAGPSRPPTPSGAWLAATHRRSGSDLRNERTRGPGAQEGLRQPVERAGLRGARVLGHGPPAGVHGRGRRTRRSCWSGWTRWR